VLGSIAGDDRVVVVVDQPGAFCGFAALEVGGTLGLDHVHGHTQRNLAVDRPLAFGGLAVVVLNGDLVAEESRCLGPPVGDERLFLRHFQLEVIT
jgi:hypothetical protein